MRTIWVHCHRDGVLVRSHDFGVPETMNDAAVRQPSQQDLEDQAESNLTIERLAVPPFAGITFEIEYPRSGSR